MILQAPPPPEPEGLDRARALGQAAAHLVPLGIRSAGVALSQEAFPAQDRKVQTRWLEELGEVANTIAATLDGLELGCRVSGDVLREVDA